MFFMNVRKMTWYYRLTATIGIKVYAVRIKYMEEGFRMIKRVGLIVILIALIAVLSWFFTGDEAKQDDTDQNESPDQPLNEDDGKDNAETLINEIFSLAKEGQVAQAPFIAGESNIEELTDEWGTSENKKEEEKATYESFPDHEATIGYQDDLIVDLRSYRPVLSNIHMNDIKQIKGQPDDINYYKDDDHDQIILTYTINAEYQLEWILSNDEENPVVDYVSVYAFWTEQNKTKRMASTILDEMNLDEKIGQMMIAGIPGTDLDNRSKSLIHDDKIGGFIFYDNNLDTVEQSQALINDLKAENKGNILPLFLSTDEEGGEVSRLPGDLKVLPNNDEIGINDASFSYDVGSLLGKELHAFGMNLNYAPVLDVNSNSKNTVIGNRSFGNDPERVGELGTQMMKGMQAENILPVVKHFPGHGDTAVDSHFELPTVNKSLDELMDLELIPFKEAIDKGADVVMVAHILLPELKTEYPSSMSKEVVTDLLREKLNFKGVIMTDDMTMQAITNNYEIGEAALESVKAGNDIVLIAHDYNKAVAAINAIKSAVDAGEISEKRIDESVKRIIQLKLKYELDDDQVETADLDELNEEIENTLSKDK